MLRQAASAMLAAALLAAPWACGGGDASTTGSGGSSTTNKCQGILQEGTCATCIEASCCDALSACQADGACLDCGTGTNTDPAACETSATKPLLEALRACTNDKCKSECAVSSDCNPVSNEGCGINGGCDLSSETVYHCFPEGMVDLCGKCTNGGAGPFCKAGQHCEATTSTCARFCCTDADCGADGVCDLTAVGMEELVGLCMTTNAAGKGPTCDAPATAVSGGGCTSFTPGGG